MNTLHNLEEIVFEKREKQYGAYFLRKQYQVYLLIAFFLTNIGVVFSLLGVFILDKYQKKEKVWDGIVCHFPPLPPLPNEQENVFSGFSTINSKGKKIKEESVFYTFKELKPQEIWEATTKLSPPQKDSVVNLKTNPTICLGEAKGKHESHIEPQETKDTLDSDKDGVIDAIDDCPFEKGDKAFLGCPPPPTLLKIEEPEEPEVIACSFGPYAPEPLNLDTIKQKISYPTLAREQGIAATVIIQILIDEQGKYVKHFVTQVGHPYLLAEVEKKIKEIRFSPAIQGGKPIKFWVNIPFKFYLK